VGLHYVEPIEHTVKFVASLSSKSKWIVEADALKRTQRVWKLNNLIRYANDHQDLQKLATPIAKLFGSNSFQSLQITSGVFTNA